MSLMSTEKHTFHDLRPLVVIIKYIMSKLLIITIVTIAVVQWQ